MTGTPICTSSSLQPTSSAAMERRIKLRTEGSLHADARPLYGLQQTFAALHKSVQCVKHIKDVTPKLDH
jgi:hypothetical protein